MKKFSSYMVLLMATTVHPLATGLEACGQQDDLFSSVRASTVFSSDAASSGQSGAVVEISRITSADDLVRTLQQADFTASAAGNRAASTTKQLDTWQYPVLVTISDDEQDLLIVLGLRSVSDAQKVPTSRLLELLEKNQKAEGASFVFNRERGRIELLSLIKNTSQRAVSLRDEINRLAILARDTESLWNLDVATGGAPLATTGATGKEASKSATMPTTPWVDSSSAAAAAPSANAGSSVPNPATGTLQGRWSASRSATDAFALQLNADATFVLVSVISGRQSRSSGKFTLQNEQLSLEGSDGTRLVGTVRRLSATEFQFTQQTAGKSAAALSFRKAP